MSFEGRAPVIAHMAKDEASARAIVNNIDHIKSLAVDGIAIRGDVFTRVDEKGVDISNLIMRAGVTLSEAEVRRQLDGVQELNAGMKNYLLLNVDKPGELTDNAAWARAIENWKIVAKVAKEFGFEGILFDNEEYFTPFQDIGGEEDHTNDANIMQLRAQASQRGREIMEAIDEVWSNAVVILPHGPYLSDPYTAGRWDWDSMPLHGQPKNSELAGAFFTGMVEGKGTDQKIVDGGEWYAQREEEDFRIGFDYRSNILPLADHMPWAIDPTVRANWAELVDQGSYLFTEGFRGEGMTASIMRQVLPRALRQGEGVMVIYSDGNADDVFDPDPNDWNHMFSFYDPARYPAAWNRAIRDGIKEAEITMGDIALKGTNTSEVIKGRNAFDIIKGYGGDDVLNGYAGHDRLFGGDGNDLLRGGKDNDLLAGEAGRDFLQGGTGNDTLGGGAGHDKLYGGIGSDILRGGDGNDHLWGQMNNDRLEGGLGTDTLEGGAGNDRLFGSAGADLLKGGYGNDLLSGGYGNDRLEGGLGNDTMGGGAGNDLMIGSHGNDRMFGGAGNDRMGGGKGNDILVGGAGDDRMFGGADNDTFIFAGSFGKDTIMDFNARSSAEKINLSGVASITSFNDLRSNHMSTQGSDVLIDAGGGNTIRLSNVSINDLDSSDFIF